MHTWSMSSIFLSILTLRMKLIWIMSLGYDEIEELLINVLHWSDTGRKFAVGSAWHVPDIRRFLDLSVLWVTYNNEGNKLPSTQLVCVIAVICLDASISKCLILVSNIKYRVIRNDFRGFNNLSYITHLR